MTAATLPPAEYLTLTTHGWIRLASGKWKHPLLLVDRRPRLFTLGQALTLCEASGAQTPGETV